MEGLFRDADEALSAWNVDSDSKTFTGSAKLVAAAAFPLKADTDVPLRDPPLQVGDIRDIQSGDAETLSEQLNTVVLAENDISEMRRRAAPNARGGEARIRTAPSLYALRQDINTIEIVKKDGKYSVVMDGVSHEPISRSDYDDEFEESRYWMPRFKERYKDKRTVQPVLFALRLEDYESAPVSCTVKVIQKVTNEGTRVLPWTTVKTEELKPYSVSDPTCTVTVLPYPMTCTPEPFIAINDYSKMREAEMLLTLSADKGILRSTTEFLSNALAQVTPGSGANWMGWKDFVQLGASIKTAAYDAISKATPAAGAAAAAGASLTTAGLAGLGTFLLWQYLATANKIGDWKIRKDDRDRLFGIHEAECSKDPIQHTFTLGQLADSVFRIAETRANGSKVDGSDRTIGYSVHDLANANWRREAALLQWLQYGEMTRASSKDSRPNPVTGRYSTRQNIEQNKALRNTPLAAGITGNTVSFAGSDTCSNCNTRTEFAYMIEIVDTDRTAGPRILIESTRANGVDAGWIACQYDKKLEDCRKAADYLEVKLNSMPGVAHWIRGHSTLVADTNNGVIIGDSFDMNLNALLGREYFDTSGPVDTEEKIKKAVKQEKAKETLATKKKNRDTENLSRKNGRVTKIEEDLDKAVRGYNKDLSSNELKAEEDIEEERFKAQERRDDIAYNPRLSDQQKQERLEDIDQKLETKLEAINERLQTKQSKLGKRYGSSRGKLDKRLNDAQSAAVDADNDLLKATREERVRQLRTKAAGAKRNFANIIDRDAFMKRLRNILIGDDYDSYDRSDAESEEDRIRREKLSQRSFWRKLTLQPSKDDSIVEVHASRSMETLCSSLSIPVGTLSYNNVMFVRFRHLHTPVLAAPNNASVMRLAAFAVPITRHWSSFDPGYEVVRTLPQLIVVSRSLVATFGNVSILKPVNLPDNLIKEQPMAVSSVSSSRSAMNYISKTLGLDELSIWRGRCHFVQLYRKRASWADTNTRVFESKIAKEAKVIAMTPSSAIPSFRVLDAAFKSSEAGGDSYAAVERLVSGKELEGTSKILKQIGAPRNYGSVVAMSVFAEILTLFLMRQGTSKDSDFGFDVQRDELVLSAMHNARMSATAIAGFISSYFVSKKVSILKIPYTDVAFHCIPGMLHLRVALRALGLYEDDYNIITYNSVFADRFCQSLLKIGSSTSTPYRVLPFSCIQSMVRTIPAAVRAISEEQSSVALHVQSLVYSFNRIVAMTDVLYSYGVSVLATRVDCICSRPVFLKAVHTNTDQTAVVISSSTATKPHTGWSLPGPRLSKAMLRHRLARLRINVMPEMRKEVAVSRYSIGTAKENAMAYEHIVESMLGLDIRKLEYLSDTKSATYVVPFGAFVSSTAADISHMQFENHPVWVASLYEGVLAMKSDAMQSAHPRRNVVISDEDFVRGRPVNPFAIEQHGEDIHLFLDDSEHTRNYNDESLLKDLSAMSNPVMLAQQINSRFEIAALSGNNTDNYRAVMHNSERLFQASLLVASGVYHDIDKDSTMLVVYRNISRVSRLAACACVGASIAAVETGVPVRAFVLSQDSTAEEHEAVKQAAVALEGMCKSLDAQGVKAVPFSELCMCISLM